MKKTYKNPYMLFALALPCLVLSCSCTDVCSSHIVLAMIIITYN